MMVDLSRARVRKSGGAIRWSAIQRTARTERLLIGPNDRRARAIGCAPQHRTWWESSCAIQFLKQTMSSNQSTRQSYSTWCFQCVDGDFRILLIGKLTTENEWRVYECALDPNSPSFFFKHCLCLMQSYKKYAALYSSQRTDLGEWLQRKNKWSIGRFYWYEKICGTCVQPYYTASLVRYILFTHSPSS